MSVYRYKIQLTYVDGKSSETTKIDVASIKSFCIERDYDNKNMPIAFMELTLDEKFDCVLLHLNGNLPLNTISKKEELMLLISR